MNLLDYIADLETCVAGFTAHTLWLTVGAYIFAVHSSLGNTRTRDRGVLSIFQQIIQISESQSELHSCVNVSFFTHLFAPSMHLSGLVLRFKRAIFKIKCRSVLPN